MKSDAGRRIDCTTANYLGLWHPADRLPGWPRLTTGVPASVREPHRSQRLARQLARLTGPAAATLYPATLHLFLDLFAHFRKRGWRVLIDRAAYPIAVWGVRWNRDQWVAPPAFFPTGRFDVLEQQLAQCRRRGQCPVILTDGWCTITGQPAPLSAYLDRVTAYGGWLVVDDTQALGILGRGASAAQPFGRGGGGSAAFAELPTDRLVLGSSLAKAFGVPLAVLTGPDELLLPLRRDGATRWHCSPPSLAHIAAGERALQLNQAKGDFLRRRLWNHLHQLRSGLLAEGLPLYGGDFPIQRLPCRSRAAALRGQHWLRHRGIDTLVTATRPGRTELTLLLRADHRPADINRLTETLIETQYRVEPFARPINTGSGSRLAAR